MADPEMTFWKAHDDNYYPYSFKQDGILALDQNSVVCENKYDR